MIKLLSHQDPATQNNLAIELKANKNPSPMRPSPIKIRGKDCEEDFPKYQVASMHIERISK